MFCHTCCTSAENEQEASFSALPRDPDSVDALLKGAEVNEAGLLDTHSALSAASIQNGPGGGFLGAMGDIAFGGENVQEVSAPLARRSVDGRKPTGVVSPKDIPEEETVQEAPVKDLPPRFSRRSTGWVG